MFEFIQKEDIVALEYESDKPVIWVHNNLNEFGASHIKRHFYFEKSDLLDYEEDPNEFDISETTYIQFIFAKKSGNYFKIKKSILNIDIDIYFSEELELNINMFIAKKNISIFKKINNIVNEDIYIGGSHEGNIPIEDFYQMVHNFPNDYELEKYVNARLSVVLREYLSNVSDHSKKYERYLNKKISYQEPSILKALASTEKAKYELILNNLNSMLQKENEYNEKQWQKEILNIIQLIYPKYILVFTEVPVLDPYAKKYRSLDYMLVDANGNIDLIEIKRPSSSSFLSSGRYRDNYVPLREFSGTIMQIEKYILYLNKWGITGEKYLTKKYLSKLPPYISIKILNPGAFIIMGRSNSFDANKKLDFEVLKRKYNNVIDIITYDDLLERIKVTIDNF